MIDITKVKYKLIASIDTGAMLDLTDICTSLTWEENEKELSSRIEFTIYNKKMSDGLWLMEKLKPQTLIVVFAKYGGNGWKVMADGLLNTWEPSESNDESTFEGGANDILFNLQKSQEYRYITAGSRTQDIISSIFSDWNLQTGAYLGPNMSHSTKAYKNDYVGDILADVLDEAKKKGAKKCFVRERAGVVDVIPRGTNSDVYSLRANLNVTETSSSIDTRNIVTRVIVMSRQDDDEDRQSLEATIDGQTQYGIHQKIITRGTDESLADVQQEAQEELDENGSPETEFKLTNVPDIPPLRKGDKIKIHAGAVNGYFYVLTVRHYAHKKCMTIELERADDSEENAVMSDDADEFFVGDKVILNGAVYSDSYGSGEGQTFTDYEDVITIKVSTSKPCPYHVGTIGWVYPSSITKA